MTDFFYGLVSGVWVWLSTAKASTIITSSFAALLTVLLEFKRHTWATALLAIVSGTFVAYIGTGFIVAYLTLPEGASHAVAGVLGISGRNLIVWVLEISRDPVEAWKGRKK